MLLSQRWCLSTAAILTKRNNGPMYMLGDGSRSSPHGPVTARKILASWWQIEDRASFEQTLGWLLSAGHTAAYREAAAALQAGYTPREEEAVANAEFVRRYHEHIGPRGLLAWDYGRAVAVTGWAYLGGIIEEGEAWAKILPAAEVLQRAYASWAELGTHYVLGHAFWGGGDVEATRAAAEALESEGESPWVCIPWATPLQIPGVQAEWSAGPMAYAQHLPPRSPPPAPAPQLRTVHARVVRPADGAFLVESGGKQVWFDGHDLDVPRDQWPDEWGPLASRPTVEQVFEDFSIADLEFSQTHANDPLLAERQLLQRGFRSVGQFFRVRATVLKHFATPTGESLMESSLDGGDNNAAMMRAFNTLEREKQARVLAANPGLTEPVLGVDLDKLALVGAYQGAGLDLAEYTRVLAELGLDVETYNKASAVWMQRFQTDPTGKLGAFYAQVFVDKQKEVRAKLAASRPAGAAQKEITFEKYCEIAGAMSAWGQLGIDFTSELERVFGLSLLEYSAAATEWATKLATDVTLMQRYSPLVDEFTARYGGTVATEEEEPEEEDEEEEDEDEDEEEEDEDEDDDW
jgi:hypothetical protein